MQAKDMRVRYLTCRPDSNDVVYVIGAIHGWRDRLRGESVETAILLRVSRMSECRAALHRVWR
jgi:hypothetical protein